MRRLLGALLLTLPGCSSILDSRTQTIAVDTNPHGAHCRVLRGGAELGVIDPTPGTFVVRKSTHPIVVLCDKPGYQEASSINSADVSAGAVASSALFGGLGWAVDSATGKANSYASALTLELKPLQ